MTCEEHTHFPLKSLGKASRKLFLSAIESLRTHWLNTRTAYTHHYLRFLDEIYGQQSIAQIDASSLPMWAYCRRLRLYDMDKSRLKHSIFEHFNIQFPINKCPCCSSLFSLPIVLCHFPPCQSNELNRLSSKCRLLASLCTIVTALYSSIEFLHKLTTRISCFSANKTPMSNT